MICIFKDESGHPVARFLKKGFRHVFCAVFIDGYWVVIDPADNRTYVFISTTEIEQFYRSEGCTVVRVPEGKGGRKRTFLSFGSCVGLTKSILGIRCFALTPYQLYKYLRK